MGEEEDANSVTVRLLPVTQTVFQLQQTLVGQESEEEEEEEQKGGQASYLLKRKLLAETFGSRKRQRMIRSAIANDISIDGDDVSQDILTATFSHAAEKAKDLKPVSAATSSVDFLPPHDGETTDASKIYDMNKIFDPELMRALEVKDMMKSKIDTGKQFKFIAHALPRVPKQDKKKQKNSAVLCCTWPILLPSATWAGRRARGWGSLAIFRMLSRHSY